MKKIVKISATVLCVVVVLFLLLPFVLSPVNKNLGNSQTDEQVAATPQVFTSNPLTELVRRIAKLFGGKKQTSSPQQAPLQPLTEAQANARFGTAINPAGAPLDQGVPYEETPLSQEQNFLSNYGDASLQNEEGEWVLIRQTTPEGLTGGMHEINAKDNAYDRYIKQERSARFTPTAQVKKQQEVPDSKLARFFQPIKKFFGFEGGTPVGTNQLDGALASGAAKMGNSDLLGKNTKTPPNRKSKISDPSFAGPTDLRNAYPGGSSSGDGTAEIMDMLSPDKVAEEAAAMVADSKYPNPKGKKQKAERDEFMASKREEYRQYAYDRMKRHLLLQANGQTGKDLLSATTETCHGGGSNAFISSSQVCDPNQPKLKDNSNIEALRKQYQEQFEAQFSRPMPDIPLTVILSKADPNTLPSAIENDTAAEMYQYMLAKKADVCSSSSCYWVANNMPKEGQPGAPEVRLENTVRPFGHLAGDPLGIFPQIQENFVRETLLNLPGDMPEDQRKEEEEKARTAVPAYVLYTKDELIKIQQRNNQLLKAGKTTRGTPPSLNPLLEGGSILYVSSEGDGVDLFEDLGRHPWFFVGKQARALNIEQNPTAVERANQIGQDITDLLQFGAQVHNEIRSMAARETIQNRMTPIVKQAKEELEEKTKEFKKSRLLP